MKTIEHWMMYRVAGARPGTVYRAYSVRAKARSKGEDPETAASRVLACGLPDRELVRIPNPQLIPQAYRALPELADGELVGFDGHRYRVRLRDRGLVDLEAV